MMNAFSVGNRLNYVFDHIVALIKTWLSNEDAINRS